MRLLVGLLTVVLSAVSVSAEPDSGASNLDEKLLSFCLKSGTGDSEDYQAIKAALEEGADINVRDDRSGQTCLMASTLRGKMDIVKLLLESGADVTIEEKDGYTPPHGAGFQGRAEVMKLLKEVGGMDVINAPHKDGFFPLHRACWGRNDRHSEVVEYLLEIGEDPNRKAIGDKKLTCAEMTNNPKTLEVLEKHATADSPGSPKDEM